MASQTFFKQNTGTPANDKVLSLNLDAMTAARTVTIPDRSGTLFDAASNLVTASGNLASTNVQAALLELQGDIDLLSNGVVFLGNWDASSGTFPGGGTAPVGAMYKVSVAGTVNSVSFSVGDTLFAETNNASTTTYAGNWVKIDNTEIVTSVFGRIGAVIAVAGDYTAAQITNTPAGGIAAVTVQTALDELDTDKLATTLASGQIFVGSAGGAATARTVSGDVTVSNTGVATVASATTSVAGKVELATDAELAAASVAGSGTVGPLVAAAQQVGIHMSADGTQWALRGTAKSATSTGWAATNTVTTVKSFDADNTTMQEMADILGNLINAMLAKGFLSA